LAGVYFSGWTGGFLGRRKTMPRYNVESDGEYACYTSISEGFITHFMSREDYEKWRNKEYGNNNIPLDEANHMTLREALFDLSLNKTDDEIIKALREIKLIYDLKDGDY